MKVTYNNKLALLCKVVHYQEGIKINVNQWGLEVFICGKTLFSAQ